MRNVACYVYGVGSFDVVYKTTQGMVFDPAVWEGIGSRA
jgi:hypothetical protein